MRGPPLPPPGAGGCLGGLERWARRKVAAQNNIKFVLVKICLSSLLLVC
jgi:hypothetical protein